MLINGGSYMFQGIPDSTLLIQNQDDSHHVDLVESGRWALWLWSRGRTHFGRFGVLSLPATEQSVGTLQCGKTENDIFGCYKYSRNVELDRGAQSLQILIESEACAPCKMLDRSTVTYLAIAFDRQIPWGDEDLGAVHHGTFRGKVIGFCLFFSWMHL